MSVGPAFSCPTFSVHVFSALKFGPSSSNTTVLLSQSVVHFFSVYRPNNALTVIKP